MLSPDVVRDEQVSIHDGPIRMVTVSILFLPDVTMLSLSEQLSLYAIPLNGRPNLLLRLISALSTNVALKVPTEYALS